MIALAIAVCCVAAYIIRGEVVVSLPSRRAFILAAFLLLIPYHPALAQRKPLGPVADFGSELRDYLDAGQLSSSLTHLHIPCQGLTPNELRRAGALVARTPTVQTVWYYLRELPADDLFAPLVDRQEPLNVGIIGVAVNGDYPWEGCAELVHPRLGVLPMESLTKIPGLRSLWLHALRLEASDILAVHHCRNVKSLEIADCVGLAAGDWAPIARLPRLEDVLVAESTFSDLDLAAFENHPSVRNLAAFGSHLTDQALAVVETMKVLRELDVRDTSITSAAVAEFQRRRPDVAVKYGRATRWIDSVVESIRSHLRAGTIPGTQEDLEVPCMFLTVGELDEVIRLVGSAKQLRSVRFLCASSPPDDLLRPLAGCDHVEELVFEVLTKDGRDVRSLHVAPPRPRLSAQCVAPLAECRGLEKAWVQRYSLDAAAIAALAKVRSLDDINLDGTLTAREGDFRPLAQVTGLRLLSVWNTEFGNADLRAFSHHPALARLEGVGCRVTDEGLAHFTPGDSLRSLVLYDTAVTDEGARMIEQLYPDVDVDIEMNATPFVRGHR